MSYGRGHCKGTKREKPHAQDWYAAIQAAHLARIEREWHAKQAQLQGQPAPHATEED